MMVIRSCVRRYGRLPAIIVSDGGSDFHGEYFERLLARYGSSLRTRPPAEARFGNVLERLFGTTNTQFIHQLKGNTKIKKENPRKITKSVDPKELARWPVGKLYASLCEWAFEIYDAREHSTLNESPRDAFTRGIAQSGRREHRMIPFDQDFIRDTLPTTDKGTAKIQRNKGVKINNTYYAHPIMKRPEFAGLDVPVKYDPWNYGIAYVYIKKTEEGKESELDRSVIGWIECRSVYYRAFQGMSERQIVLATEELRRRHNLHGQQIDDGALSRFLYKVKQEEKQLDEEWQKQWELEQERTIENNDIIRAIMGELTQVVELTDKSKMHNAQLDPTEQDNEIDSDEQIEFREAYYGSPEVETSDTYY